MELDGPKVHRALANRIRPVLSERGFEHFDTRSSWRRTAQTVDVISFNTVGAYYAGVVGCTSMSFTGEVGVYYPALSDVPVEWPLPHAEDIAFRAGLGKTIRQPIFRPSAIGDDQPSVWYVLRDGSNLDAVVDDALAAVVGQALPYLDRLDDPDQAMEELLTMQLSNSDFGRLRIMGGRIGSPSRLHAIERLRPLLSD